MLSRRALPGGLVGAPAGGGALVTSMPGTRALAATALPMTVVNDTRGFAGGDVSVYLRDLSPTSVAITLTPFSA